METEIGDEINNEFYHELGERWYSATDHPVALLRAEARMRNPWVAESIRRAFPVGNVRVLDVGCGAGFLANHLATCGFDVTGLDASAASLRVAESHDATHRVRYDEGDAYALPYPDASFHSVCSLDFLEHVTQPQQIIAECARVLRPQGLFIFATFQRTLLSWLIAIKGVEWFVNNTPARMHQLKYFIKPGHLQSMCSRQGLRIAEIHGSRPVLNRAFLQMLITGNVRDDFAFAFTSIPLIGYMGVAISEKPG